MVAMLVAVASTMNPLDGLCATSAISEPVIKSSLLEQRQGLNPTQPRVRIDDLAGAILGLATGT